MSVADINYRIEFEKDVDFNSITKVIKSKFDVSTEQQDNTIMGVGPYCSDDEFIAFFVQIAKCVPDSTFEGEINVCRHGAALTIYKATLKNKELEVSEIKDNPEDVTVTGYQTYVEQRLPYEQFAQLLEIPAIDDISCESADVGFDSNAYVDFIFECFQDGDFLNMNYDEFKKISEFFEIPEVKDDVFEKAKIVVKELMLTEDDFENNNKDDIVNQKVVQKEKIKLVFLN